ncbi:MAG: cation:proton antiporter [Opitutales bacterium]|nr:cation:proton antiporter [Opitutales bacterium]
MTEAAYFIRDLSVILLAAALAGYCCKRLSLSPIVGYLGAGLFIGTPEVTFIYVVDEERIHLLSQIGVIFLMFSIGLGIQLKRLKALGLSAVIATVLIAFLLLTIIRAGAGLAGISAIEGLFFAALFMVSSSAIIGKVLQEMSMAHERSGRLAMGITLLEDFVAIALITFLGSLVAYEAPDSSGGVEVLKSLGLLGGFVILVLIAGLLIIPRVFHKISKTHSHELEAIFIGGLLFLMAILSVYAGYSFALGAFLCGLIIAETRQLPFVERAFSGMKDVFAAVFFVAIGMSIQISVIPSALHWILLGTLICLILRPLLATVSLLLLCEDSRTSIRTGLSVSPIGEFSFIIAGMGVASGVIPERFQVIAVGVSLLTSLIAPVLMARSEGIANWFSRPRSQFWMESIAAYRKIWGDFGKRQQTSILWRLLRFRILQVIVQVLFISALLVFANPIYHAVENSSQEAGHDWLIPVLPYYWFVVSVLILIPLVALWRNVNAVSMIIAESFARKTRRRATVQKGLIFVFRVLTTLLLFFWLINFLPYETVRGWMLAVLGVVIAASLWIGWRRFIRWHSDMEIALHETLSEHKEFSTSAQHWAQARQGWGISLHEFQLPDRFKAAGQTLSQLALRKRTGATIVSVERQGFPVSHPGPQTHLYPGDELLLMGNSKQVTAAIEILNQEDSEISDQNLDSVVMESMLIKEQSPIVGKTLAQLNWPRLFGAQVAAIRRGDSVEQSPAPNWVMQTGDELLIICSDATLGEIQKTIEPQEP